MTCVPWKRLPAVLVAWFMVLLLVCAPTPSSAQDLHGLDILQRAMAVGRADQEAEREIIIEHGNDSPFGSDGAGPTAYLAVAMRRGDAFAGVGLSLATPELKMVGDFRRDPLVERGRVSLWAGKRGRKDLKRDIVGLDYAVSARVSAAGGWADEFALGAYELFHNMTGVGIRPMHASDDVRPGVAATGFVRLRRRLGALGPTTMVIAPYVYGMIGTDVIEGAGGLQVALSPVDEGELPFLPASRTAAHAPMFGGDGVSAYVTVRGVVMDDMYGGLERERVLESGITAQGTLRDRYRIGANAACAGELYLGADKPSCMASLRLGARF